MLESFRQLMNRLRRLPPRKVCFAAADRGEALETARDAVAEGIAKVILVGHRDHIWRKACNISLDLDRLEVIHEPDPDRAMLVSLQLVKGGGADVLAGGQLDGAEFLSTLSYAGMPPGGTLLSQIAAYEIPGCDRLLYVTDGGINACPGIEDKVAILRNAVDFLHSLGIEIPRVAFISANERVSPRMPVTVEARGLAEMVGRGEIPGALGEGPMALDVAVSREAARQKGISGPVAGSADLLFVPSVEVGNTIGRLIVHFARGKMAAVVLGAGKPVVLMSEDLTPFGKLCSLALACYSPAGA